jgi:cytochrome c-type biogenesis protein CcmH
MIRLLTALLLLPLLSHAQGVEADAKAEALYARFMAPCCYTGLLRDHHSDAAEEMKEEIRSMLGEGRTESEVVDAFVARYGERILSNPPERGFNRLAILMPVLAVAAGAVVVGRILRRQKARAAAAHSVGPSGIDPTMDERIEREIREGM